MNDLVAVDNNLLKIIEPRAEVVVVQREISGGQPRHLRFITCRLKAQEQMAVEIQVKGMPDTGDCNHAFQRFGFECVCDLTFSSVFPGRGMVVRDGVDPSTSGISDRQFQ